MDELAGLFEQLDFGHVEAEADDMWNWSKVKLFTFIYETDRDLARRDELLVQTSEETREMFARRCNAKTILENKKMGRAQDHSEG
jgi:hypothetical protein